MNTYGRQPVDPSATSAWQKLDELADQLRPDLRQWFDSDKDRAQKFTFEAGQLHVDLSKNLVTEEIMEALLELAEEVGISQHRDDMFSGQRINVTENRAVLHTALRRRADEELVVEGSDVVAGVHQVLGRIYDFADQVRSGSARGITGKKFTNIVNIGIGGSDLGPVMVYEALKPYTDRSLPCSFISNVDPTDVAETLHGLDPETTLVIVTSKTFTTIETLTNAQAVRDWMLEGLKARGAVVEGQEREAIGAHFVAVSTALDKVEQFGIIPERTFGFWDWVGGRYSVDSAVGTVLAIALGSQNFAQLLAGFRAMDRHFQETPLAQNVPVLMALLNVWYSNFLGADTHAVLPYSQYLHRFPAYLQQLTMESNGKSVRWDGSPVTYDTGEIFWGEPGTNGQHAFYQLIHQGTRLIPADFIAFVNPAHQISVQGQDMHQIFLSNFFAQTQALAFGKSIEEVRAEGSSDAVAPARVFDGNRPTTSIMAPELSPAVLGQLIALYEHITFVEGSIWGLDSFDQWGVELGKVLANRLLPAVDGNEQILNEQDASTQELIRYYWDNRQQ